MWLRACAINATDGQWSIQHVKPASCYQKVTGSIPCLHVEVSLSKILNPKLLLMCWSAPCMAATISVWMYVWITVSWFGQKHLLNALNVNVNVNNDRVLSWPWKHHLVAVLEQMSCYLEFTWTINCRCLNFHFIRALFICGGFKAEVESSFLRAVEGTVLPEKVYLIAFLVLWESLGLLMWGCMRYSPPVSVWLAVDERQCRAPTGRLNIVLLNRTDSKTNF